MPFSDTHRFSNPLLARKVAFARAERECEGHIHLASRIPTSSFATMPFSTLECAEEPYRLSIGNVERSLNYNCLCIEDLSAVIETL